VALDDKHQVIEQVVILTKKGEVLKGASCWITRFIVYNKPYALNVPIDEMPKGIPMIRSQRICNPNQQSGSGIHITKETC